MARLTDSFISDEELYNAYRKAKVDAFFERSQAMSVLFCRYEKHLHQNLSALGNTLRSRQPTWFKRTTFVGGYGLIPKRLTLPPIDKSGQPHFGLSDPEDAWKYILKTSEGNKPVVEFRPVAHFTVDMYVVSALWLNLIGHKYDACLDSSARGSRLRRLHVASDGTSPRRPYHKTAPGSFQPYFFAYRAWRDDGIKAIENELSNRRRVVAVTMDLASFYHNIDASFLCEQEFLSEIKFDEINDGPLSTQERTFTEQLVVAFKTWAQQFKEESPDRPTGIPVGPSASAVIANVLLRQFDLLVQENLDPIYYARYVDDIFLVLRDSGKYEKASDVLNHICKRIEPLEADDDGNNLRLVFPYASRSQLVFQAQKQRIFLMSGEIGQDLLDTIKSKIDEVASEWRMLPSLSELERSPAAKALTASRDSREDADSLRKADDLSLRRLGFALMLRNTDAISQNLRPKEWEKQRRKFYRFATRHILTPLRILDLNDYLPRLLGLAVACHDWKEALWVVKRIKRVISELRDKVDVASTDAYTIEGPWDVYLDHLYVRLEEAVVKSCPTDHGVGNDSDTTRRLLDEVRTVSAAVGMRTFDSLPELDDLAELGRDLFWCDLGRIPFKDYLLRYAPASPTDRKLELADLPQLYQESAGTLREFLAEVQRENDDLAPLLFPTRPLNAPEITECVPKCALDVLLLSHFVRAARGTWVRPQTDEQPTGNGKDGDIVIGLRNRKRSPRIAVTSFLVAESSWAQAANGTPDLSPERYQRLVDLANAIIRTPHRPDYVVFPELSIPRKWLPNVAEQFLKAGISVIAGTEYCHIGGNQVVNEAWLYLTDDRLGYPSWTVLRQRKGLPAHVERDNLRSTFGLTLADPNETCKKRVYRHEGFGFGVLICSELSDVKHRQEMRGKIDCEFILSWNRDLESFSALVDATALDIHCYVTLVNNRKYGDSRVRVPHKDHWMRDLIRVKGGLDDYFVVTDLEIYALREFQSNIEPPARPFKPTPEGFVIEGWRKRIPGGGEEMT